MILKLILIQYKDTEKKRKKNKEERVESLVEGREEFVTKAKPQHKSKTNTEKKEN